MLPWSVGVFFVIGLVIFIYLIKSAFKSRSPVYSGKKVKKEEFVPRKEDIILAQLTEKNQGEDYGILWNAPPGTYNFEIERGGEIIASGSSSSETGIYKVRGIPLQKGEVYNVKIGETKVKVPFSPPEYYLESLVISNEGELDCNTSSSPTNIEAIMNNKKISLSNMKIKIEPPGFIINYNVASNPLVIMIYNGENAANILTINPENNSALPGQTPLPF